MTVSSSEIVPPQEATVIEGRSPWDDFPEQEDIVEAGKLGIGR